MIKSYVAGAALALAVAGATAASAISPALADSELAVAHPTFYIIAPGSDPAVTPIVSAVATTLQKMFDSVPGNARDRVWVIPRLGWSPDDLQNQCKNDPGKDTPTGPQVLGGLIVDGTNSYASTTNSYLLWVRGWTKIETRAQIVSCAPLGYAVPTITWISTDAHGYSSRNGFPVGTGLATGLYLGTADSNTKSFALGATISGFDDTSAIPPVDPAVEMHDAAHRAANQLLSELGRDCTGGDPAVAPVCIKLGMIPPPAVPPPAVTPAPAPAEAPSAKKSPSPKTSPRPKQTPQPNVRNERR